MVLHSLLANIQALDQGQTLDKLGFISPTASKTSSNKSATTKAGNKPRLSLAYRGGYPVVPLSWAATTSQQPFGNLGDALSPVIISALSGLPIAHQNFRSLSHRLASVGTIAGVAEKRDDLKLSFKSSRLHFIPSISNARLLRRSNMAMSISGEPELAIVDILQVRS